MSSWYGWGRAAGGCARAGLSGNPRRKTPAPSNMVSVPVKPKCAIAAAVMPLRAAGPGLKRFCIDGPYISIKPDACAPASPNADVNLAGVNLDNLAAATVAPNTPQVGVV